VPEAARPALLAVLREALSNAVRHAQASAVAVTVAVRTGRIELRVLDNGVGLDGDVRSVGGLRNMYRRAEELGGTCTVARAEAGGTQVTWSVPT
jgi:two-component system, NarL family, sensor histidine kinase DevS